MRVLLGAIVLGLTALTAGFIGFQAGIASNIGAAGGAVYLGGGASASRGSASCSSSCSSASCFRLRAAAARPWGPYGHGAGATARGATTRPRRPDLGRPASPWIADAHRRLHEEEAGQRPASTAPAPPRRPTPTHRRPADPLFQRRRAGILARRLRRPGAPHAHDPRRRGRAPDRRARPRLPRARRASPSSRPRPTAPRRSPRPRPAARRARARPRPARASTGSTSSGRSGASSASHRHPHRARRRDGPRARASSSAPTTTS